MAEARVERRLAAILAADIAGYSRLMGADEVGTLAALKALRREIVDPAITAHKGRIVKTTGDEALAVLDSAARKRPSTEADQADHGHKTRIIRLLSHVTAPG